MGIRGRSLQKGVLALSIVSMVVAILYFCVPLVEILRIVEDSRDNHTAIEQGTFQKTGESSYKLVVKKPKNNGGQNKISHQNDRHLNAVGIGTIIGLSIAMVTYLIDFGSTFLLWSGGLKRNELRCRQWLMIGCVLWMIRLFMLFWVLSIAEFDKATFLLSSLFVTGCFLWVVYSFRKELLEEEQQGLITDSSASSPGPSASYTVNPQ